MTPEERAALRRLINERQRATLTTEPSPAATTRRPQPHDPYVVPAAPLIEMLTDFSNRWVRHRPHPRPEDPTPAVASYDPVDWLAQESGVSRWTIEGIAFRRESRSRKTPTHVELRIADPLLTAIGRQDAIGTEVPIMENPKASMRTIMNARNELGELDLKRKRQERDQTRRPGQTTLTGSAAWPDELA